MIKRNHHKKITYGKDVWLVYLPGIIKGEIHLATNHLIRLTLIHVHVMTMDMFYALRQC